ncbi:MAG TPA: polyprenol phosphomannose-dependent alpha 1,6 mannosyltransferase MptB [Solirubrobacterales bacterium]|nr:polyprenol phosphomannose-dependent alpha 1,6 mannosyltransferase MptB [Solirubrobacterales bacterium]
MSGAARAQVGRPRIDPGIAFALMWAGFAGYLGVLALAPRLGRRIVWGAIALLVTGFAVAPVLLSHDVYSYVAYARLGVQHGLDPYVHPPSAAPADPAYAKVAWTEATSAYGPLFTLASYPLAWLPAGVAVAVLKAVAALSVLGIAATAARIAAWRGADPRRAAAFVALNPLVLVHVVGGAHNDGVTMLLAMLAVAALLAGRELSAGAALTAAVATKLSAAVIAPFALIGAIHRPSPVPFRGTATKRNRRIGGRLVLGSLGAMLALGVAAWLAFGWDWLHGFGLAGENQSRTSYMSIPILASRLTGLDPDATRFAAAVLFLAAIAGLLAWTWRGGDWIRASAWATLALLLATAWLLPWYLIWLLPLAAISRDRPLRALTLLLTAYQLGARIPL